MVGVNAMVIFNNMAAMSALNETKRNDSKLGKVIKQAASGKKLNSAGDDAAGYSIATRMKVRLRALNQDDENVRKGESLLKIAEGAIQSQMNLLKTVKERVINAHNDTNTDADRAIIQKEIDQCYEQISSIAYSTDFDGKKLLIGSTVVDKVSSWVVHDTAVLAEDSDITGLLTDIAFDVLDGEQGPFATFGSASDDVAYDGYNVAPINPESLEGAVNSDKYFSGGTPGASNTIDISLAHYTNAADLNDRAFYVSYGSTVYNFVLTNDTSKAYDGTNVRKIDISGCTTTDDVAIKICQSINSIYPVDNWFTATSNGSQVVLTTKAEGAVTNNYTAAGSSLPTGSTSVPGRSAAAGTGLSWGSLTGGANAVTRTETYTYPDPTDPDRTLTGTRIVEVSPAVSAEMTISGVDTIAAGTGVTFNNGYYGYSYGLVFEDSASGLRYDSTNGYYVIGKNYQGTFVFPNSSYGVTCTMSGGNFTAKASAGAIGNQYSFSDGITAIPGSTITYTHAAPLTARDTDDIKNNRTGADGDKAHWDIDLSAYDVSDTALAEQLIQEYVGKAIGVSSYYSGRMYEFIDTGSASGMDGVSAVSDYTIDLNAVRTAVRGGRTVAEAFAAVVDNVFGSRTDLVTSAGGSVTGLRFWASTAGTAGNSQYMVAKTGDLRSYTIDWVNWVNSQGITDIPSALHDKGFRFYCATDSNQWVNVRFINGMDTVEAGRPASGNSALDIKTLTIDLQGISTVEELVNKIDADLGDYLVNTYRHNFMVASDAASGTTTIYDKRKHTVLNDSGYDRQEKGAKIATGVMDNVVKDTRNIYVNDLVIQHTDKASVNIHIKIPQTSIDQIFGYKEGTNHITEYNVMTSDMREQLLGKPPAKGILDTGIEYLTDAQTLIGAQINHMRFADENILTQNENLTSAASVIQDADMAKVSVEYAKYNLLQQASQSMLAQANHVPQGVLSLLQ